MIPSFLPVLLCVCRIARLGVRLLTLPCGEQGQGFSVDTAPSEDWLAELWRLISGNAIPSGDRMSGDGATTAREDVVGFGDTALVCPATSSVQLQRGDDMETDPPGLDNKISKNSTEKLSHWNKVLSTVLIPLVVPIPRSLTWCRLTENYWADEDPVLRYVPYFGDDDLTGFDTSYYEYVPGELEGEIGGEVLETTITVLTDLFSKPDPAAEVDKGDRVASDDDVEPLPTALESCLMVAFGLSVTQVRQVVTIIMPIADINC
jgi:hypothetical protein